MTFALRRAARSGMLVALLASPAMAQQRTARIITDTPDYCWDLARRAQRFTAPPPAARDLAREGEFLCGHGEIRAGIIRLRRALVFLEQTQPKN